MCSLWDILKTQYKQKSTVNFSIEIRIALIILSITGFVLVMLFTKLYGTAVSPDSIFYISTARNLAEGNGLISFDGAPLILWPPLYPIILAIPDIIFNIDPLVSSPVINALIFGFTIFFSGLLFNRYLVSTPVYPLLGATMVLFSPVLQDLSTKAWSENLFILLIIIFLFYLDNYLNKKKFYALIIISITAGLAYLTRYIGIVLLLTGFIVIILHPWDKLKKRLVSAIIFSLIAVLPVILMVVRNYLLNGLPMGVRSIGQTTLFQNLILLFNTIISWSYFPPKSISGRIIILLALITILILFSRFINKDSFRKIKDRIILSFPIFAFIIIYLVFILYSTTKYLLDPIGVRFLSPIYIPVCLVFLLIIDLLLDPVRDHKSNKIVNTIFITGLAIWIILYPMKGTFRKTIYWMEYGTGGFTSTEWNNSPLIKYMKVFPLKQDQKVFSNEPEILYIQTNIISFPDIITVKAGTDDLIKESDKSHLDSIISSNDVFVWFRKYSESYPVTKEQLDNSSNLKNIIQLEDGAVYTLLKNP